ncbi:hypothetical protein [Frondihabitans cladoniiphilus]|uniref:Uncharacterized protein n=1 Tax=Frondihabitans cladoniiphilus TaxID=715785 RepID=A0ABP8W9X2_9MICO
MTATDLPKNPGLPASLEDDPRLADFVPVEIPSPEDDALTAKSDSAAG